MRYKTCSPLIIAAFALVCATIGAMSIMPPGTSPAHAQNRAPAPRPDAFSIDEVMTAGHRFFGETTKGLAQAVEYLFAKQGRPNGYILGEEAGGAFIGGLRYGEGTLYTRNAGDHKVYWQGPSVGWDFGGDGAKTMILVYKLDSVDDMYDNFGGVAGSAYLIGGAGITILTSDKVIAAPIRTGLGLRLGVNVGYLKFTRKPTWNPF